MHWNAIDAYGKRGNKNEHTLIFLDFIVIICKNRCYCYTKIKMYL